MNRLDTLIINYLNVKIMNCLIKVGNLHVYWDQTTPVNCPYKVRIYKPLENRDVLLELSCIAQE